MDFNRGQQIFRTNPPAPQPEPEAKPTTKRKKNVFGDKFSKITFIILLVASTLVAFGAIVLLLIRPAENLQFVNQDAYQAVDVITGGSGGDQVYFGKITKITDRQIVLTNVFYPVSNEENNTVTTLVPFICSLASPYDQIILNRDQVAYWYNLQSESKVTKTIDQYKQTNEGKPNCDQLNSNASAEQNAASDEAEETPATTTPAPTAPVNKPSSTNP
jgi:hypothetical protein